MGERSTPSTIPGRGSGSVRPASIGDSVRKSSSTRWCSRSCPMRVGPPSLRTVSWPRSLMTISASAGSTLVPIPTSTISHPAGEPAGQPPGTVFCGEDQRATLQCRHLRVEDATTRKYWSSGLAANPSDRRRRAKSSAALGKICSGIHRCAGSALTVPAPTRTAPEQARRSPITKRSASFLPLITDDDAGAEGMATTPSSDETKFAMVMRWLKPSAPSYSSSRLRGTSNVGRPGTS